MEEFDKKKHWDNIYRTKELKEVSWYQPIPQLSINFIEKTHLEKNAAIIDVGGGDSFLVDHLLKLGYTNLTVLDISEAAIERAKQRLGEKAKEVKWVVSDILDFKPETNFDLWHDRAAFHFLTDEKEIKKYVEIASQNIVQKGHLIVGAFSENGPKKCSGIEIAQYSPDKLNHYFGNLFELIESEITDHSTPFNTTQNFVFCRFIKK